MLYQIIKADGGAVVALVDELHYIRQSPTSTSRIAAGEADAQGIAVSGTAYNLLGREPMDGLETVVALKVDSGVVLMNSQGVTGITFVTLAESGNIDGITAGEHPELFEEWAFPVDYKTGQIRRRGGKLYRCIQDHTSQVDWTPEAAVSLWVNISDPAEEWPEWSQPVGATDAYMSGDKVSHNGAHWISSADNNVWEPGVYGWTQAES